jgi:hypothetical protein
MDEYHNILSEEFPSPVREHEPLPPAEETRDDEQTIHSTLEQIVEEHAAGSGHHTSEPHEGSDLLNVPQHASSSDLDPPTIQHPVFDLPQAEQPAPVDEQDTAKAEQARQADHAEYNPDASLSDLHANDPDRRIEHGVGTQSPLRESSDVPPEKMELDDPTDRRKGGVKYQTLTEKEKKERQKLQNRRAAEKSRAKKRDEL